jgi:hypothetical protein
MTTTNGKSVPKYKIRVRHADTGEVSTMWVTKDQICEGLDDKDMKLEDIGLALLNDLRTTKGLVAVSPLEDPIENKKCLQ